MISNEFPRPCIHRQCRGHAIPATWKYVGNTFGTAYYCDKHAKRSSLVWYNGSGKWVQLTPNQRPVSVKE